MYTIGIDIGSTTVCAVIAETVTGKFLFSKTVPNKALLTSRHSFEHLQDPKVLLETCQELLDVCLEQYPVPISIGFTGQMHGILYLDALGNPLSPLYTWQDQSGKERLGDSSYAQVLSELTGYPMASGFGITTYFYHLKNKEVPEGASTFCTIADYVAMKMAGRLAPLLHPSMAASLGAFHLSRGEFDFEALEKAGIPKTLLPQTAREEKELGIHSSGASVTLAIGDNQASYCGSCPLPETLLVNIGTGSQVSLQIAELPERLPRELEVRPYLNGSWLLTASSLCGGSSYALLKQFFVEILEAFSIEAPSDPYAVMNEMAKKGALMEEVPMTDTRFLGSRTLPDNTGSIQNLTPKTFHPAALTYSVLNGICEELYELYTLFPESCKGNLRLVGSGNGLRKNPFLQSLFSERFQMPLSMTESEEEAAYGCARYASDIASGKFFYF